MSVKVSTPSRGCTTRDEPIATGFVRGRFVQATGPVERPERPERSRSVLVQQKPALPSPDRRRMSVATTRVRAVRARAISADSEGASRQFRTRMLQETNGYPHSQSQFREGPNTALARHSRDVRRPYSPQRVAMSPLRCPKMRYNPPVEPCDDGVSASQDVSGIPGLTASELHVSLPTLFCGGPHRTVVFPMCTIRPRPSRAAHDLNCGTCISWRRGAPLQARARGRRVEFREDSGGENGRRRLLLLLRDRGPGPTARAWHDKREHTAVNRRRGVPLVRALRYACSRVSRTPCSVFCDNCARGGRFSSSGRRRYRAPCPYRCRGRSLWACRICA